MTHVTRRRTAKNEDQLRNPTLGSRVWATLTFYRLLLCRGRPAERGVVVHDEVAGRGKWYELVIQTPPPGVAPMATRSPPDVLSVRSMLQHLHVLQVVRAAATLSVELFDVYATFSSIYLKKNLLYTLHRVTVT